MVNNTNAKTVAIYHLTDNPYFPAMVGLNDKRVEKLGVEVAAVTTGLSKDEFSRQVNKTRWDPDIVYISADNLRGIGFAKEAVVAYNHLFLLGISQPYLITKSGGDAVDGCYDWFIWW